MVHLKTIKIIRRYNSIAVDLSIKQDVQKIDKNALLQQNYFAVFSSPNHRVFLTWKGIASMYNLFTNKLFFLQVNYTNFEGLLQNRWTNY